VPKTGETVKTPCRPYNPLMTSIVLGLAYRNGFGAAIVSSNRAQQVT